VSGFQILHAERNFSLTPFLTRILDMEPPHAGRSPTPPCIRSSEKLQLSRLQLVGAIHTWNTERDWTDRVMAGSRADNGCRSRM